MIIRLTGPDTYRSHQRFRQLYQAFVDKHDPRGYNTVVLDATAVTLAEFRSALTTTGFLATKRFVGLNYYDPAASVIDASTLAATLKPYADTPDVIVVVREVATKKARTSKAKKAPAKKTTKAAASNVAEKVETFPMLTEAELRTWLNKEVSADGGTIEPAAAAALMIACEKDTWRMASELQKLVTFAGSRPITPTDIELFVTAAASSDIFALTDAIGNRQRAIALRLLNRELSAGTHPLALITIFANHIRNLRLVQRALAAGQPVASLPTALDLHPFVVQKAVQQARHFTPEQLAGVHDRLLAIDYDIKTSPLEAETLLEMLLATA